MPYSSKRIVGKYVDFVKLETADPDPDHKFYADPDPEHRCEAMLRIRYRYGTCWTGFGSDLPGEIRS
jgi:hypothetical protein